MRPGLEGAPAAAGRRGSRQRSTGSRPAPCAAPPTGPSVLGGVAHTRAGSCAWLVPRRLGLGPCQERSRTGQQRRRKRPPTSRLRAGPRAAVPHASVAASGDGSARRLTEPRPTSAPHPTPAASIGCRPPGRTNQQLCLGLQGEEEAFFCQACSQSWRSRHQPASDSPLRLVIAPVSLSSVLLRSLAERSALCVSLRDPFPLLGDWRKELSVRRLPCLIGHYTCQYSTSRPSACLPCVAAEWLRDMSVQCLSTPVGWVTCQ